MKTLWLIIYFLVLIWSGINPKDYYTWLLEVFPALIGFAVIAATFNRFRLTPLTYLLILVHCMILMVGGHYTYAEVPLFNWLRDTLGMARNNYDKLGHLAQGFIPAIIAREILLRKKIIIRRGWLPFLSSASAWRSAHFMSSLNGGLPCYPEKRQRPFWAPRAISGIPSRIWDSHCSGPFLPCCCSREFMTGSWKK